MRRALPVIGVVKIRHDDDVCTQPRRAASRRALSLSLSLSLVRFGSSRQIYVDRRCIMTAWRPLGATRPTRPPSSRSSTVTNRELAASESRRRAGRGQGSFVALISAYITSSHLMSTDLVSSGLGALRFFAHSANWIVSQPAQDPVCRDCDR